MTLVQDETSCGPICQHPLCWQSQRRCFRGLPKTRGCIPDSDSEEDEGLPTQKVVNLLDNYTVVERKVHYSAVENLPRKSRALLPSSPKSHSQWDNTSSLKMRAPNVSPSRSSHNTRVSSRQRKHKILQHCEVHEVYDTDELKNDWRDTFDVKKYYVWVPNECKTKKGRRQMDPAESLSMAELSTGPTWLTSKDVTEEMVPKTIHADRLNELVRVERRLTCKTPSGGQPYSYPYAANDQYNGLYDLLDLPRDVLIDIMKHIDSSELRSKHEFVEAVMRTLPKLEKTHTAISLASSNVLQQQPIKLLDVDLKNNKFPVMPKKVYLLADPPPARPVSPATGYSQRQKIEGSAVDSVKPDTPTSMNFVTGLNKMAPLPAIPVEKRPKQYPEDKKEEDEIPDCTDVTDETTESSELQAKISSIGLGLSTKLADISCPKPFTYSNQNYNFTLKPVPSMQLDVLLKHMRSRSPSPRSLHPQTPSPRVPKSPVNPSLHSTELTAPKDTAQRSVERTFIPKNYLSTKARQEKLGILESKRRAEPKANLQPRPRLSSLQESMRVDGDGLHPNKTADFGRLHKQLHRESQLKWLSTGAWGRFSILPNINEHPPWK